MQNTERPANKAFNRINNFKYKIPVRKIYRIDDAPVTTHHINSGLKTETSKVSEKEINSISVKVNSPMNRTLQFGTKEKENIQHDDSIKPTKFVEDKNVSLRHSHHSRMPSTTSNLLKPNLSLHSLHGTKMSEQVMDQETATKNFINFLISKSKLHIHSLNPLCFRARTPTDAAGQVRLPVEPQDVRND